jgi:DNA-binding transcriptional MerR regulator
MTYTVKKLAKLSGVSVRTLHFYDEIGLLKPAYYGDNHYRYYEEEQLLMLQQILFYRKLGIPLSDIQRIIASDDFDKIKTLESHRQILESNLDQTTKLIKTIDNTIARLRGNTTMKDEELFYGLESERQKGYEKYIIEKGWMSEAEMQKSREQVKGWKQDGFRKIMKEGDAVNQALADAMQKKLKPDCPEVQKLVRMHYEWIKNFWIPNRESYTGLGNLYCEHPEFHRFFEQYHPHFAEFLAEAMRIFAEREL